MYVLIGNEDAVEGYRDPTSDDPDKVRYRPLPGQRVTEIRFPEGTSLNEALATTTEALRHHMTDGSKPTWVESDSEGLEALLKEHFDLTTAAKRKASYGEETGAKALIATISRSTLMQFVAMHVVLLQGLILARLASMELRTNAGRDFQARVMGDTASTGTGSYASASYIGLTADTTAASAASTTLTGEIASGTLTRAQATYAHTNGQATYTLTKTFTSDQTVVIAKIGVFNASSGGTLVFETLLNATASLVSGDQLQITETVTL